MGPSPPSGSALAGNDVVREAEQGRRALAIWGQGRLCIVDELTSNLEDPRAKARGE